MPVLFSRPVAACFSRSVLLKGRGKDVICRKLSGASIRPFHNCFYRKLAACCIA